MRYIVELFTNPEINSNGAQLVFTSHDMTTMKPLKARTRKKLEETMRKKTKQVETMHELPPYTVIFS